MHRPRTTPFHERLAPLNETGIWKHWAGHLVAPQYQASLTQEYYAIRNAVALLDTSPLFKLRFTGPDARALLEQALVRDIGRCPPGRAQYTCWCDPRGFVEQDGVVMHTTEGEYLLTAAEPALRHFRELARQRGLPQVEVEDVSTDWGILALQGPHAHEVLGQLTDDAAPLRPFQLATTRIAQRPVTISRTGYTGDLGYEIWVRSPDAIAVWDALVAAGRGHNLTPLGTTALKMARVEAGLLLLGVDFQPSRQCWVDEERDTPLELGWEWMLRGRGGDPREFVGREAIEAERRAESSRWTTVGLGLDWRDYERVFVEAGVLPPHHELYAETTMSVYRRGGREWDLAGHIGSFLASSLLRRPIGLAKLPLDLARPGVEVDVEVTVIRRPCLVRARVEPLPFFDPPRRTAPVGRSAP